MIKKFFKYIYVSIKLVFIRLSIAMFNTEQEILKADPNALADKDKKNQKVRTSNPLHRKMEQGQRDQKFVKDYYEVLKKADKFMKNATPHEMELAASRHGMSLGKTDAELKNVGNKKKKPKKDRWGRRYDHFGFFDPKSKHYGKTMAEVMIEEIKQRVTKDDNYQIEFMFSNKPTTVGLVNNEFIVEDEKYGFRELNSYEKAKRIKHPMTVQRKNEKCVNKIEQLTEYVHVKRLDDKNKIIEFFIPSRFKVFDFDEKSDIFTEIIDVDSIWLKDEYDVRFGYSIDGYYKRTEVIDESIKSSDDKVIYHVIKLKGKLIENIN